MNENRLLGSWLIASIFIIGAMGYEGYKMNQTISGQKAKIETLQTQKELLLSDLKAKEQALVDTKNKFDAHRQRELTEIKTLTKRAAEFGWIARGKEGMTINDLYDILDKK